MILMLLQVALAAPCEPAEDAAALERHLLEAETAIGELESDRFLQETADLTERLRCLDDAVDPAFAAHVHRVVGLRAFIGRQSNDALLAFSAAKAADSTYVWPESVLPKAHAVRDQLAAAPTLPDTRPLARPKRGGQLAFDGVPTNERPMDRPVLMQVLDSEGAVQASGWLQPSDPLLDYDARHPFLPPLPEGPRRVRAGLLITSAVAAVGAGALYSWAAAGPATTFQSLEGGRDQLSDARRQTNTLVTLSATSGAVAATTFGTALLFGRF